MRIRCAVLDDYQGVALTMADWSSIAGTVDVTSHPRHFADPDELVAAIGDCEIVVVMRERTPFPAALFARLPRLRLLVTSGRQNASIDLAAAAAHGVTVCGTASSGLPPAELTWALILGLARNLVAENTALRGGGPWQSTIGTDLHGRRLGLIGLGRIGGTVATVGRAFGMDVIAWSQHLGNQRCDELGVQLASSKEELLESSDFVSIHLALGERSRGLIGAPELRLMRRSAYLVNTARAAIVDRSALLTALTEGWIAGAGLDVFETEPLPADDPLRTLPNVLATPHLGYVTQANYRTYFPEVVADIAAFLAGSPIRTLTA
ncbi:D-2-hydroxyacid dehydrogenase family protein [Kitasatospora sp. NPDC052896]|uniref:D-2-hydroxyacid dehydrogenase family protein n=1 Tax=Kitasatospora sp. NPDC052896 TaxID=3364061 RepID=UPI0037C5E91B